MSPAMLHLLQFTTPLTGIVTPGLSGCAASYSSFCVHAPSLLEGKGTRANPSTLSTPPYTVIGTLPNCCVHPTTSIISERCNSIDTWNVRPPRYGLQTIWELSDLFVLEARNTLFGKRALWDSV